MEPCCHVHTVAEQVAILLCNVSQVDAKAECDALFGGHLDVPFVNAPLLFHRTENRSQNARELDEKTIARGTRDVLAMF